MEEFNIQDEYDDFTAIYKFLKDSKMMYRVSLDSLNPKFSDVSSTHSLVEECVF